MQEETKKNLIKSLAKTVKRLRGDKSQYSLGGEYGIAYSIINDIERGVKDPQYTTIVRLAVAFNLSLSEFSKELEKDLPDNFDLFEE